MTHLRPGIVLLLMIVLIISCRIRHQGPAALPLQTLWTEAPDSVRPGLLPAEWPFAFRMLMLNEELMRNKLGDTAVPVAMPLPDGVFQDYMVSESTTLEPALLEKYPHLRTYRGIGADDPSSTARFDLVRGFHGYLLTPAGSVIINPVQAEGGNYYICYYKHHAPGTKQPFEFNADSVIHRE